MLRSLLFFVFLAFTSSVLGQNATVRGFVYDKLSGEPIIFTNVYLKGTQHGTSTDVNGYYSISKIPPGSYTLTVNSLGYEQIDEDISLRKAQILSKKLFISPQAKVLSTFDVSADKAEARNQVKMSVQKITPKEIEKMPSIGGEPDHASW